MVMVMAARLALGYRQTMSTSSFGGKGGITIGGGGGGGGGLGGVGGGVPAKGASSGGPPTISERDFEREPDSVSVRADVGPGV